MAKLIFRQLYDDATSTFTYLLADADSRQAVIIDSVFERHLRDLALVRELELELKAAVETHIHADHVTGAWLLREATGCEIAVAAATGAEGADRGLADGDRIEFGGLALEVRATPGHTDGCLSFLLAEPAMVFTGDALLIRGAGRTDFQQGDPSTLFASVREKLFSLSPETTIYPGHDYSGRTATTVDEERKHNPRLGDSVRKEDFVGYMNNLGLPHPKRIAEAVPANLKCGEPSGGKMPPALPDWGPVIRTYAGVLQVEPEWVHRNRDAVQLLDVREAAELEADLPAIPGALNIPLGELPKHLDSVPRGKPVIAICAAGARSARAAQLLEHAGLPQTANLRGGVLEWMRLGLPVA